MMARLGLLILLTILALAPMSAPPAQAQQVPMCMPIAEKQRLTSSFKMRPHPITNIWHMHTAVDFGCGHQPNAPIYAVHAGVVLTVVNESAGNGCGNYVFIKHDNGWQTGYCHLSSYTVSRGQPVARGQVIGTCGNSGVGTGPHLHWIVQKPGRDRIDPLGPEALAWMDTLGADDLCRVTMDIVDLTGEAGQDLHAMEDGPGDSVWEPSEDYQYCGRPRRTCATMHKTRASGAKEDAEGNPVNN